MGGASAERSFGGGSKPLEGDIFRSASGVRKLLSKIQAIRSPSTLDLEPLAPAQDAIARFAAQKLFQQIEQNAGQLSWLCAMAVCPLW